MHLKKIPQGLGCTNIHFYWTCLDLKTNISERASRYALGINEMTGVTGRPRQGLQGLGYTNINFHWTCLDLETNISERASKYVCTE